MVCTLFVYNYVELKSICIRSRGRPTSKLRHLGLLLASQTSFPRTKSNNVGVKNIVVNKVMMLLDRLVHRTHEGFEVVGKDGVATEHGFLYCGRPHKERLMDGRTTMWSGCGRAEFSLLEV